MLDESSDDDLMSELAEEFVTRLRRGEHPDWTEYAGRHPELAEDVRELFPALILLEKTHPKTYLG